MLRVAASFAENSCGRVYACRLPGELALRTAEEGTILGGQLSLVRSVSNCGASMSLADEHRTTHVGPDWRQWAERGVVCRNGGLALYYIVSTSNDRRFPSIRTLVHPEDQVPRRPTAFIQGGHSTVSLPNAPPRRRCVHHFYPLITL